MVFGLLTASGKIAVKEDYCVLITNTVCLACWEVSWLPCRNTSTYDAPFWYNGIYTAEMYDTTCGVKQSVSMSSLQWRQNERDGVPNHQLHDCLLHRLFKAQIKANIIVPRHWPLCGKLIGDRWIPRTKGQLRGKCFHLMTSSWLWKIDWGGGILKTSNFLDITFCPKPTPNPNFAKARFP